MQPNFRDFLLPSEMLLWEGAPSQGLELNRADLWLVPFSLLWGGFAIFWEVAVVSSGGPLFFTLWGVPFVLFGLYFIAGRFVHDAWLRSRTFYAVTDRRILCLTGPSRLRSLDLAHLPMLELREEGGARGTLLFDLPLDGRAFWSGRNGISPWAPSLGPGLRFHKIDRPRSVYDLIARQSEALRRGVR